jgi:hypothetical protein
MSFKTLCEKTLKYDPGCSSRFIPIFSPSRIRIPATWVKKVPDLARTLLDRYSYCFFERNFFLVGWPFLEKVNSPY